MTGNKNDFDENVNDKSNSVMISLQNENKMLGRAQDPRANGAWLSKLTECKMKCLS